MISELIAFSAGRKAGRMNTHQLSTLLKEAFKQGFKAGAEAVGHDIAKIEDVPSWNEFRQWHDAQLRDARR